MKELFLEAVFQRIPSQRQSIRKAWNCQPDMPLELERFLDAYKPVFQFFSLDAHGLADIYCEMVGEMLHARLEFLRSGTYGKGSAAKIDQELYQNPAWMMKQLLGLALSHFTWRHHYQLLKFYREISGCIEHKEYNLEIGSGHGLYTQALLANNVGWASFDILDISPTALQLTRQVLESIVPAEKMQNVSFCQNDVIHWESNKKYDFITMGEVLEHVEAPEVLLRALKKRLSKDGKVFITTCANSPSPDHVYHFQRIQEIRELIYEAGFSIVRELVAPSVDKPLAYMEENKLDVSYAAVLEELK